MTAADAPRPHTPARLRALFDPLPHPARTAALARYARALAPDDYRTLHAALDSGSPDDRHTALFLAVVRRDLDTVGTALGDPLLRSRALSAAARLPVPDGPLAAVALGDVRSARHDTYRVLRLSRRTALADRLLPRVRERHGDADAARLLPACSPEAAAEWLPRLEVSEGALRRLARTAPAATAARLVADHLARPRRARHRPFNRRASTADLVAERDPEAGLSILRHAPALITPRALAHLLKEPRQVLRALRGREAGELDALRLFPDPPPPSAVRALRTLPTAELAELALLLKPRRYHWSGPGNGRVVPDPLISLLPPGDRRRVVGQLVERGRGRSRNMPLHALAALDPQDRAELLSPVLARIGGRRPGLWDVPAAAVAPLAEAEPVLREVSEGHRSHERALAWAALITCAEIHGDPDDYARIVASCERAWHDQDEVRRAALEQISRAPSRLLAAVPQQVLKDAVLTAFQSRDSGAATLAAAERWLRRTAESLAARGETARAAEAVLLLCRVTGGRERSRSLPPLRLEAAAARAVWQGAVAAVSADGPPPGLTAAGGGPVRTAGGPAVAVRVALAELLSPHLGRITELDALMGRVALGDAPVPPERAARAAAVWVRAARTREERSALLLRHDPSYALVRPVFDTVATRRTDLLGPLLTAAAGGLTGRLRPRPEPWVPRPPVSVLGRWLPEQRSALARHLAAVAADDEAPLRERADAAGLLRDPERLLALAARAPQPVAAAALGALGALGGAGAGEGVGAGGESAAAVGPERLSAVLLRHAGTGGVRGRAAMSALRRLLLDLPGPQAVALLAPVACSPDGPVGSRKEAVRALGALLDASRSRGDDGRAPATERTAEGEAAFRALLTSWDAPGQHRDVQAVLARFLLARIDREDVAERLSARLEERAIRDAAVTEDPDAVPAGAAPAYAAFLASVVRGGTADSAAAACTALPRWVAADPEATRPEAAARSEAVRALASAAGDPDRPRKVWREAAEQLAALVEDEVPGASSALRGMFAELLERTKDPDPGIRTDSLRRLDGCVIVVGRGSRHGGPGPGTEVADAAVDALLAAGLRRQATRIAFDSVLAELREGRADPTRWNRMLELAEERPDRLPIEGVHLHLGAGSVRHPEAFRAVAARLRERGTAVAGLLALAVVREEGRRTGWEAPWPAELEALCSHPDPETAGTALLVDPGD
ncbi:hypothetical protein ACFV1B_24095 [Streptomyces sp. NPDC059637]|uniref:hypothetical protein n=1 Tax=Streptomyces sp. NPDC059637 TaxID=3347752 RepID=UPI0036CA1D29